jgi:hypothetical protein
MADYFLALDADAFEGRARPALAESSRRRSFEPCRDLCAALLPAARAYAERYHTGADEPLLTRAARGLPFDRALWRALVGEVLLYSALEIPEFQVNADALCCLLAPQHYRDGVSERARLAPIQQAHRGARDLTFGAAVYRPDHAGYSGRADVVRLAEYLEGVRPEEWTAEALLPLREPLDEEGRADELAFVREWFPALRELYQRCRDHNRVLVIEQIF